MVQFHDRISIFDYDYKFTCIVLNQSKEYKPYYDYRCLIISYHLYILFTYCIILDFVIVCIYLYLLFSHVLNFAIQTRTLFSSVCSLPLRVANARERVNVNLFLTKCFIPSRYNLSYRTIHHIRYYNPISGVEWKNRMCICGIKSV